MPLSIFSRSPPSESPSRFSAFQANVRSLLNGGGSSIYSNSPVVPLENGNHSNRSSRSFPKLPTLDFLRRPNEPLGLPTAEPRLNRSGDDPLPLPPIYLQHTAGSYLREIDVTPPPHAHEQYLVTPPTLFSPEATPPQTYVDPETEHLAEIVHGRRPRKHRRRHKHRARPSVIPFVRTRPQWVRKKNGRGSCVNLSNNKAARGKLTSVTISAVFLGVILSIYLCIVLLRPNIGQEVHVLFILVIICTTIFFCHALVRLCMVALRPPVDTPRVPNMQDAEGFHPIRPIRVHLARDEEAADGNIDETAEDGAETEAGSVTKSPKKPPPAYGLWRSSVRVDPNLLHWQRVSRVDTGMATEARFAAPQSPLGQSATVRRPVRAADVPRPPSYSSEDGVAYVVSAAPRSVAPPQGTFEVHPAFRHPADRLDMPSDR